MCRILAIFSVAQPNSLGPTDDWFLYTKSSASRFNKSEVESFSGPLNRIVVVIFGPSVKTQHHTTPSHRTPSALRLAAALTLCAQVASASRFIVALRIVFSAETFTKAPPDLTLTVTPGEVPVLCGVRQNRKKKGVVYRVSTRLIFAFSLLSRLILQGCSIDRLPQ